MADQRAEADLRKLQCETEGVDPAETLAFLGDSYEMSMEGGLVAVLRFAALATRDKDSEDAGNSFAELIATHKFLSECLCPEDWPFFEEAAITGKAGEQEVSQAARRAVEILTARPAHAGMRLLAWAAANLGELDGQLLRSTGTPMADLSARQLCNIIFAARLEGMDEADRKEFTEDLNAEVTASQKALSLAQQRTRQMQAETPSGEAPPAQEEAVPETTAGYLRKLTGDTGGDFSVVLDE